MEEHLVGLFHTWPPLIKSTRQEQRPTIAQQRGKVSGVGRWQGGGGAKVPTNGCR